MTQRVDVRARFRVPAESIRDAAGHEFFGAGNRLFELHVRGKSGNDGGGNHTTNFYTSSDGVNWTELGDAVTESGTVTIFDGTAPPTIGSMFGATYSVEAKKGDGTTLYRFDAGNGMPLQNTVPTNA